jgi:hypothetical protein
MLADDVCGGVKLGESNCAESFSLKSNAESGNSGEDFKKGWFMAYIHHV